jgi:hypothetical protein
VETLEIAIVAVARGESPEKPEGDACKILILQWLAWKYIVVPLLKMTSLGDL